MGARALLQATKEGTSFAMYATSIKKDYKLYTKLPIQYEDFIDVFEKKKDDILPDHRPYDCAIDLQSGAQPPFRPIYNLSEIELIELHKYMDKNLSKNFIRHSKSTEHLFYLLRKKTIHYVCV